MDISIVIPCRDEADNVQLLHRELTPVVDELRREASVELVFVDDGSTDGTGDLLKDAFREDPLARIVRHDPGRGLGAAIRTGFRQSTGSIVVTTDCDASYPFSLIPALLAEMGVDADIVTASCYHPAGGVENVPAYRVVLSKSASLMYRLILDRSVHTYTCMFRAYRRQVIDTVPFKSDGFVSMTEILAEAMLSGYLVRELPCVLRARRYGASKARVLRIVRTHLQLQWKLLGDGRVWRRGALSRASNPRSLSLG